MVQNLKHVIVLMTLGVSITSVLNAGELEGGLKFNSYEQIKDLRTGINFTPTEPIETNGYFEMNFSFAMWREFQAYGHVFRIFSSDEHNIDLVSSPYNSKFDDLNLILGDSLTAVSFSFDEIGMLESKWTNCNLIVSAKDNYISLEIDGIKKTKSLEFKMNDVNVVFGKNTLGQYTTSDVPPMSLKEVVFKSEEQVIRNWPLTRYLESSTYDEIGQFEAVAENPIWMVARHIKWTQDITISTTQRPQIVFDGEERAYLLTANSLITYNLITHDLTTDTLGRQVALPINQASLYSKEKNEIVCYDLDSLKINRFDLATKSFYEINSTFSVPTSHWHANKTITKAGDNLFFGGYGHYNYSNELLKFDGKWEKKIMTNIEPRYLAALGQTGKGDLYILGGYGSKNGSQEYGAKAFHQLFKIDQSDFSSTTVWIKEEESGGNVFSNSMVFNDSDSIFYILRYPRAKFNSKAILEGYDLYSSEKKVLGDSIEIDFLDINSYVDLFRSKKSNELIAVIVKMTDNQFQTTFHSLNFPPIYASEVTQSKPNNYSQIALLILVMIILTGGILRKRKKVTKNVEKDLVDNKPAITILEKTNDLSQHEDKSVAKKSAILFLGGFQVLDKDGNEISGKFSSTIRTLLTMLLLYSSNNGKGVPSNFIWESLWGDKSQSSARNNRNVNIKKLRDILQSVGSIEIKNTSDKWIIELGSEVFFDYRHLLTCIESDREISPSLIALIKRGNILTSFELDWIDPFKADFSNKIVDYLIRHSKKRSVDDDMQHEIADGIFKHDIINQDALFIQVKYFNSRKRFSLAKKSYEAFKKEYELLYGEEYDLSFDDIIKSV